eukprot:gene11398-12585_t
MQKLNAAFDGAFRKIGLRKIRGKDVREACFQVKALSLTGMPVADVKKEDSRKAVTELVDVCTKDQAVNVVLCVSAKKGVKIKDKKSNLLACYKMHDIANCTLHGEFPEVFVFTARQNGSKLCHAFYCFDISQAEAICLAMSDAFQAAFEAWVKLSEEKKLKETNNASDHNCNDLQNTKAGANKQDTSGDGRSGKQQGKGVAGGSQKTRRSSVMSITSAFSFNSQADEVFQSLLSVDEEDEQLDAVLLRRGSIDWDEIERDDNVQRLASGEEIEWEK